MVNVVLMSLAVLEAIKKNASSVVVVQSAPKSAWGGRATVCWGPLSIGAVKPLTRVQIGVPDALVRFIGFSQAAGPGPVPPVQSAKTRVPPVPVYGAPLICTWMRGVLAMHSARLTGQFTK